MIFWIWLFDILEAKNLLMNSLWIKKIGCENIWTYICWKNKFNIDALKFALFNGHFGMNYIFCSSLSIPIKNIVVLIPIFKNGQK